MNTRGFQPVPDEDEELAKFMQEREAVAPPPPNIHASAAVTGLMLALKALSQRALIALADLFTLITVLAAFYLWISLPDPNDKQLIALGMYAVFTLVVNVIVRRK